jgi:photosystem II stability/assembly factor-like uncharacterized protein
MITHPMMIRRLISAHRLVTTYFLLLIAPFSILFGNTLPGYAHSPHDVIDALETGELSGSERFFFIVVSNYLLMRSADDGASWRELCKGLDNKHRFTSIIATPNFSMSKTVFVSTDGDGIYVSTDAGLSWKRTNAGLSDQRIKQLVVSPAFAVDGLVGAIGTHGSLNLSKDRGRQWHSPLNQPGSITALCILSDRGKKTYILAGDKEGQIHFSKDLGATWKRIKTFVDSGAITTMVAKPQNHHKQTILVGTESGGIFRANSLGDSFAAANSGITDKSVRCIVFSTDSGEESNVFATTWSKAIFKSKDDGLSWQLHSNGLSTHPQANVPMHKSPHFRDVRVLKMGSKPRTMFLGGFDGLFRSLDGGDNWLQLETLTVGRVMDMVTSPQISNEFDVAITTYGGGAYVAKNSSLKWKIQNKGLSNPRLAGLAFSPNFESDQILFSGTNGYLLKSRAAGNPWEKIRLNTGGLKGVKKRLLFYLRRKGLPKSFTTDLLTKQEKANLYPNVIVISPHFKTDRTLFFSTRRHGVFRYRDDKQKIYLINQQLGIVSSLALSPQFGTDRLVIASARQKGIFKSSDAGASWQPANSGLMFLKQWQKIVPQTRRNAELDRSPYYDIHLLISPSFGVDHTLFAASGEGLYKSTNAAASWSQLADSSFNKNSFILAAGLSPAFKDDQTLIISVKGKGLFKSYDSGKTFLPIGESLLNANHSIVHIQFSPLYAYDRTIYAASEERIFRSIDGGINWNLIARPVRYENIRDVIKFSGDWTLLRANDYSAGSASYAKRLGSKVEFRFVGTGIRWIGETSARLGWANIYLDGKRIETVDQNIAASAHRMFEIYEKVDLPYGAHQIQVEVAKSPADQSGAIGIVVDAFDVLGSD